MKQRRTRIAIGDQLQTETRGMTATAVTIARELRWHLPFVAVSSFSLTRTIVQASGVAFIVVCRFVVCRRSVVLEEQAMQQ